MNEDGKSKQYVIPNPLCLKSITSFLGGIFAMRQTAPVVRRIDSQWARASSQVESRRMIWPAVKSSGVGNISF
jgi:hypothetical protein